MKKVPQKPCFKICRGGGGDAIRVCIGQGSHCKMKVFSIFTIGARSSRGVWGHAPPENFEN